MPDLVRTFLTRGRQILRQMIGIPDYERYVQHVRTEHPGRPWMTYEEFFRDRQQNRYEGKTPGSRCC